MGLSAGLTGWPWWLACPTPGCCCGASLPGGSDWLTLWLQPTGTGALRTGGLLPLLFLFSLLEHKIIKSARVSSPACPDGFRPLPECLVFLLMPHQGWRLFVSQAWRDTVQWVPSGRYHKKTNEKYFYHDMLRIRWSPGTLVRFTAYSERHPGSLGKGHRKETGHPPLEHKRPNQPCHTSLGAITVRCNTYKPPFVTRREIFFSHVINRAGDFAFYYQRIPRFCP